MQDVERIVYSLLKEVLTLPEKKMQIDRIKQRLSLKSPEEVARILERLYGMDSSIEGVRRLKSIFVDPDSLMEVLGEVKYRLTYLSAVELGIKRIAHLFTNLPPHKKGIRGYSTEEEAKMELITLGERRALAKRNDKDTIDRLLSDPDPMVIRNLLSNPRVTEAEVVKIASKRPNSAEILKLVATHQKWSRRYPVIKAIVLNPYTPPRIATGLLEFLLAQDLKAVSEDRTLHPQVKMCASQLLKEKEGGRL